MSYTTLAESQLPVFLQFYICFFFSSSVVWYIYPLGDKSITFYLSDWYACNELTHHASAHILIHDDDDDDYYFHY